MSFLANALNNVPIVEARLVIFESNGTYTPPDNLAYAVVTLVGGGGGSGGRAATGPNRSIGGAGGGGGAKVVTFTKADLSPSVSITVGAAGAAGAAGTNPGGNGGTSEIGTSPTVSANGGGGGPSSGAAATLVAIGGGSGGSSITSGATLGVTGQQGNNSWYANISGVIAVQLPSGGDSLLGFGGPNKSVALKYGGGGGSCENNINTGAQAGFAGSQGVIMIEEFLTEPV